MSITSASNSAYSHLTRGTDTKKNVGREYWVRVETYRKSHYIDGTQIKTQVDQDESFHVKVYLSSEELKDGSYTTATLEFVHPGNMDLQPINSGTTFLVDQTQELYRISTGKSVTQRGTHFKVAVIRI